MKKRFVLNQLVEQFPKNIKVTQSISFLISKKPILIQYRFVEDLATDEENTNLRGVEHHLINVRAGLAKSLWSSNYFIGVSVLDNILLNMIHESEESNLIRNVFLRIRDLGIHQAGFVLYPIHSFGVLGAGLFSFVKKTNFYFSDPKYGLVITSQTNNFKSTVNFLKDSCKSFKINKTINEDLVDHFEKSRPIKWIKNNPLLLIKVNAFSQEYYENQFHIVNTLKFAISYLYILSALSNKSLAKPGELAFSTSRINNFQTLDIKHYMVFSKDLTHPSTLSPSCIPINIKPEELASISSLDIEINPKEWLDRGGAAEKIRLAIRKHENLVWNEYFIKSTRTKKGIFGHKIFLSLNYFRDSFKKHPLEENKIVSLAIAFESLLSDRYVPGVTNIILSRVRAILIRRKEFSNFYQECSNLFSARGETVHLGSATTLVNLDIARKAWIYCYLKIMDNAEKLDFSENDPMAKFFNKKQRLRVI